MSPAAVKLTNMGWPGEDAHWRYTHLTEPLISSELARLAAASTTGDTDSVSFQPCPDPDQSNQDRSIIQDWQLFGGTWSFRAVFDGHAGHDTVDYAAQELPGIIKENLFHSLSFNNFDEFDSAAVSSALRDGIATFDQRLTDDLLHIFPDVSSFASLSDVEIRAIINDAHKGGRNSAIMRKCMRGSTILISLLDPSRLRLWVASLGDCQAVLGTQLPSGRWQASILSSFHNGQNEAEVSQIRREHPNEQECVLNERVLGAIAVTRAVGDHLFKLPSLYTQRVFMNAEPGFMFSSKVEDFLDRNLTPPYLSNRADVQFVDLKACGETERHFLILCSDGLLDLYYDSAMELQDLADLWVKYITEDNVLSQNLALSLLREALGGTDDEKVSRMMTVEMGTRWMDDTTIVIQKI
ncbi:protein serine threonine phosphatase 2C [Cyathus striatus]|nr:protein serine threonine phosphatase 2C [Cyathus striatus]